MQFEKENGDELLKDSRTQWRLRLEAEKAKISLSSTEQAVIELPFVATVASEPVHLATHLTQSQLSSLADDLIKRTLEVCKSALSASGHSPGDMDAVLLVGGMTRMPAIYGAVTGFFGLEPITDVNPDEVVAMGAAIQAGIMGGDVTGIALLDVTPLTLGVETRGGLVSAMIPRNTTIPTKHIQSYTTVQDDQVAVRFDVVQGERPMAKDNTLLGGFTLDRIPPAPRGTPSIEVAFDIDANGILQVSAHDTGTGRKQNITITAASGLSSEEVARANAEAEKYAQEDKARKHRAEADNEADINVYRARKLLRDNREKLERVDIIKMEYLIEATEEARSNGTAADITKASEELAQQTREMGGKLYR